MTNVKEGTIKQLREVNEDDLPRLTLMSLAQTDNFLEQNYTTINDEAFIKWIYRVYYN